MAHTALLARRAYVNVAPECMHEYEFMQLGLGRLWGEFPERQRWPSRRGIQGANGVDIFTYVSTLEKSKYLYSWIFVAVSAVMLVELILVIDTSLSLLSNSALPVTVAAILLTISISVGIRFLMGRLISKTLNMCLKREENMRSRIRRKDNGREVIRFQFEIDPDLWKELERFQQEGGLTTKRELLNNALTLFKWAAQHKERGNSITATGPSGTIYELEMPVLESIEANSQRKIKLVDAEDNESASTVSAA